MSTSAERYINHGLVIPRGTTKDAKKIKGSIDDLSGNIGISVVGGGTLGLLASSLLTLGGQGDFFMTIGAGSAIGATAVFSIIQRIRTYHDFNFALPAGVYSNKPKGLFFKTRRTLMEKRTKLHSYKSLDVSDDSKEIYLVTNHKGVWVETTTQRSPLNVWDDAVHSVVSLYSIEDPKKKITEKVSP